MTTVEPSKPSSAPTPSKLYPSPITTTYAARTFSFITSIAATPIASPFGLVSAAALGISAIAAQVLSKIKEEKPTGALSESHKVVKQENIPFADKKKNMTLAERLTHNARVAILATVPFIGIQLADYYNRTGKIQGFEKHAILEATLQDLGADPRRMIFNDASRMKKDPTQADERELIPGMWTPSPSPAEIIKNRAQIWQAELVETSLQIEGEKRTTDVTLIKGKNALDNAPTVLYYHGNGSTRYHNEEIKDYLDKGYNVLLCSYDGDYTKDGSAVSCTESGVIKCVQAHLKFLQEKGVKTIGLAGTSLGTGVAGHAMTQALSMMKKPSDSTPSQEKQFKIEFIYLKVPFSRASAAAERFVQNLPLFEKRPGGHILGRLSKAIMDNFFATEMAQSPACNGFNTADALQKAEKKLQDQKTKIIILDGVRDNLMGGKERCENYNEKQAQELELTEKELEKAKVEFNLQAAQTILNSLRSIKNKQNTNPNIINTIQQQYDALASKINKALEKNQTKPTTDSQPTTPKSPDTIDTTTRFESGPKITRYTAEAAGDLESLHALVQKKLSSATSTTSPTTSISTSQPPASIVGKILHIIKAIFVTQQPAPTVAQENSDPELEEAIMTQQKTVEILETRKKELEEQLKDQKASTSSFKSIPESTNSIIESSSEPMLEDQIADLSLKREKLMQQQGTMKYRYKSENNLSQEIYKECRNLDAVCISVPDGTHNLSIYQPIFCAPIIKKNKPQNESSFTPLSNLVMNEIPFQPATQTA